MYLEASYLYNIIYTYRPLNTMDILNNVRFDSHFNALTSLFEFLYSLDELQIIYF